ncbi:MAG: hypothetical protein ACN6NX_04240 [Acinetobacter sp.]
MWIFQSFKRLIFSFAMTVFFIALLFWLYLNIQANLQVTARDASVELSHSLPTQIQVGNYLQTQSSGTLNTQIKIDRTLTLPLQGKYLADLQFAVEVPVAVNIDYETVIKINQTLPLNASTDLVLNNKLLPKFPMQLDIPIQLDVPFHLKRTYKIPIKILFDGPVHMAFDEPVRLHVLHQFAPQLNINDPMTMRKIASFRATMYNTERNTRANLTMQMNLPIKNIHP